MKPLIVLDFDDTLVNTSAIKQDVFAIAMRHGVSREAALLAYTKARTWPFTLAKFAEALWSDPAEQAKAVRNLETLFEKPRAYNYVGVEHFLKILGATCRLDLVTFGSRKFQEAKVKQSGLRHFFSKVIYTDDPSKEKVLKSLRKATKSPMVLLDDSLTVCAVGEELGIATIRVQKTAKSKAYYTALLKRIAGLLEKQS